MQDFYNKIKNFLGGFEGKNEFIEGFIDEINEGINNPIKVKALLTLFIDALTEVKESDTLKECILSEIEKNNGEYNSEYYHAKKGEFGVKYDFSVCQHSEWQRAKTEEDKAAKKRKEIEKLLKSHSDTWITEDGEIIQPPVKKSTTNVSITLKK